MSKEDALLEERERYPLIKEKLKENQKEILRLYEIAWKSWDRDPENHDGAPSGIMEMYEEIIRNYNRHQNSPYFARIIFKEEGSEEKTDVYIGKIGYVDLKDSKLIDWRAPISDLYYNAPLGIAEYKAPLETESIRGELSLKRQIKIDNNFVEAIYDFENAVSSDEFLKPYLTTSADNRLKNIVSTIQQEQNQIIRWELNKNIVVQGVAGSGKTTVALHRLSYLMYNYRKFIKPKEFMIISPNKVFKSYISSLLVDLDADQAYSYDLEGIFREYTSVNWKILAKHEQYEKLMERKISPDYLKFKSEKGFIELIDKFLENLAKRIFYKDLIIDGVKVIDKEKMFSYYQDVKMKKLLPTFDAWVKKVVFDLQINNQFVGEIDESLKQQDVPFGKRINILRTLQRGGLSKHLRNFLKEKLLAEKLYTKFINEIDEYSNYKWIKTLKLQTLENLNNKTISYEDMFPIMYIQSKLYDIREYDSIKHVFIDEAQDISYFGYYVVKELFPNAYFSIFGDLAQGLYSYQSIDRWEEVDEILKSVDLIPLTKSYRTSIEIMQNANLTLNLLGMESANNVIRHGEDVEVVIGQPRQTVKEELNNLKEKGYKTIAVICKDKEELSKASNLFMDFEMSLLDENNNNYDNDKPLLMTVQTAKGLEFDSVIIFNENSYNKNIPLDLKQLYVAKTRALHKLYINKF